MMKALTFRKLKSIYINKDGIGALAKEKVTSDFQPNSFEITIRDFKGKNYKLSIPKLFSKIVPEKSSVRLKKNYLVLKLVKGSMGKWTNIKFEKKFNPTEKMNKKEDPQVGLMKMMQRMYQEGDDGMKRTISEAFTKASQKK